MAGTDQRAGDRFVEHPDEVKVERDDGASITFCWLDHDRVCTGGCQAFDPRYADDETGAFTACRFINLGIAAASAFSHYVRKLPEPTRPPIPGTQFDPPGVK